MAALIHCQQRRPLFLEFEAARLQMFFQSIQSKISIGMSPTKEEIEEFEIHATWFFEKELSIWFEHARNFVKRFAPFRDVMQNAEDDNDILAGVCELT